MEPPPVSYCFLIEIFTSLVPDFHLGLIGWNPHNPQQKQTMALTHRCAPELKPVGPFSTGFAILGPNG